LHNFVVKKESPIKKSLSFLLAGFLLLCLALFPWLADRYALYVASLMAVNIMIALGLNLLVGNTGQISLGQAGFVAMGAYTVGYLHGVLEWPLGLALLLAGLGAAVVGAGLGRIVLRLHGPYLAIATLGFGMTVITLVGRFDALGGRMGLQIPRISETLSGHAYDRLLFGIIIGSTLLLTWLMWRLIHSRIGAAFHAIRDQEMAAAAVGIDLAKYKTLSFAISAAYAGLAGGFWALLLGFIQPGMFSFMMSVVFLAGIALGGLGKVSGSILGAGVMTYLSLRLEQVIDWPLVGPVLKAFSQEFMSMAGISYVSWVLTGLLLILVMLFEPRGLVGLGQRIWLSAQMLWKRSFFRIAEPREGAGGRDRQGAVRSGAEDGAKRTPEDTDP
jgi:branched-chain amino acid transport system permease protein